VRIIRVNVIIVIGDIYFFWRKIIGDILNVPNGRMGSHRLTASWQCNSATGQKLSKWPTILHKA